MADHLRNLPSQQGYPCGIIVNNKKEIELRIDQRGRTTKNIRDVFEVHHVNKDQLTALTNNGTITAMTRAIMQIKPLREFLLQKK